ncbi:hypothetical protein [Pseudomonas paralactis]|nr:hypothetical protein [Pseudomonas paralactis]
MDTALPHLATARLLLRALEMRQAEMLFILATVRDDWERGL